MRIIVIKNNTFPVGFENNLLIQLYSEVVDLYMQNPKSEISVKQYDTYKEICENRKSKCF